MGWLSKDIQTMDHLFVNQLQDLYYAEHQIAKSLVKMIANAVHPALKATFEASLVDCDVHIQRLEKIFLKHSTTIEAQDCIAIDGLLKGIDDVTGEVSDQRVLDAALIAAAQAVEHYQISRYGSLISWAKSLGHIEFADELQKTLDAIVSADQQLTSIANLSVNPQAA